MSVSYEMNDLLMNFSTNGVGGQAPLVAGSFNGDVNQGDVGIVVLILRGIKLRFTLEPPTK